VCASLPSIPSKGRCGAPAGADGPDNLGTASAEAELQQILLTNADGNGHLIFRGSTPTIQKVKL
jgi:hypothetical protein